MKSLLIRFCQARGRAATIFLFILLCGNSVWACEFASQDEVIKEITKSHPELRTKDVQLRILEANIDRASQVPNPQLNLTSNHGNNSGTSNSETTGSLQYVFELGGKKSSRIGVAEGQHKLGQLKVENNASQVLINSSLMLARHTQVNTMLSLYKESLEVFKKMRASLRRSQELSPEQQIQEDIVDMEVSKHRIRISKLTSEFLYLNKLLKFYTGKNCKINIQDNGYELPDPKSIDVGSAKAPELKELEWESKLTGEKLSLAKSESYPDLKIGPSFQLERGRGQDVNRFGISLTMELPILNRNQGGRAMARQEKSLSDMRLQFMKTENEIKIQSLLDTYQTAYETLNLVPNKKELLKKHHRIEELYLRGLVSISTMIEGHDELLNLMEERDKHELLALETYLKINQAKDNLMSTLDIWRRK